MAADAPPPGPPPAQPPPPAPPATPSLPPPAALPEAVASRRRWPSAVWLVPLAALAVVVWLALGVLRDTGTVVRIGFRTAEGLEPGKTRIKYRELDVGTVRSIELAPGHSSVIVSAEMTRDAVPFLTTDARFWVVRPRFAGGQVSGISTLLSGSYIGMAAGTGGDEAREFTGLEVPPIVTGDKPGRQFVLHSAEIGSLSVGSPVTFRQLQVGQLVAFELDRDGGGVTLRIFVEAPYDRFVVPDTRFWNASGVDLSIDATGVKLRTESLVALLAGGIAFETPTGTLPDAALAAAAGASAAAGSRAPAPETVYTMWANRAEAMKERGGAFRRYRLVFDQSVRGLAVGAPVDFRGVVVGEVTRIGIEYDRAAGRFRMPVDIDLHPQRLAVRAGADRERFDGLMKRFVERGFRAQLRNASLITGSLFVALDFMPKAAPASFDARAEPPEIPTIAGDFEQIQNALLSIAKNLEKVPFDQVANELREAMATLKGTLGSVEGLVRRADATLIPELQKTLEGARATLAAGERAAQAIEGAASGAQQTLGGVNGALAPDSALQTDLRSTLREVSRAAEQVRQLADYLNRHPEALVRGKPEPPK